MGEVVCVVLVVEIVFYLFGLDHWVLLFGECRCVGAIREDDDGSLSVEVVRVLVRVVVAEVRGGQIVGVECAGFVVNDY